MSGSTMSVVLCNRKRMFLKKANNMDLEVCPQVPRQLFKHHLPWARLALWCTKACPFWDLECPRYLKSYLAHPFGCWEL